MKKADNPAFFVYKRTKINFKEWGLSFFIDRNQFYSFVFELYCNYKNKRMIGKWLFKNGYKKMQIA